MRPRTTDAAEGRWPGILAALGVPEKILSKKHGPCPWCGGKDRFRFSDHNNRGSWVCTRCGSGDGIKLLMQLNNWDFKSACREVDKVLGQPIPQVKKIDEGTRVARCTSLWTAGRQVEAGDPVQKYLKARVPKLDKMPADIRHHPACFYDRTTKHPAMLALILSPEGRGLGIHRTYLSTDGKKAPVEMPKKTLGARAIAGGAIRLMPATTIVGIAEGIETALAASIIHKIPVWSCLSAAGVQSFVPPAGIEEVVVLGDNDENGVGQIAAYTLMQRLHETHRVKVILPPTAGHDWADEQ
jgi:putative DNA primase/helicase